MNAYLISGVAVVAFMSGWSVNDWRHDAKVKKAQDRVRAEEQVKLDALRTSLDSANSERLSLAADLAAEKTNIKIKYRTITQEVPIYAPQNTDTCNYDLDPGLVRLLNAAARGSIANPESPAEPAGHVSDLVSANTAELTGKPNNQSD